MRMHNLVAGQQVRTTVDKYTQEIKVHTLFAGETYRTRQEIIDNTIRNRHRDQLAFAIKAPGIITADYPGKAAQLAAERECYRNCVLLEDGDVANIEGNRFEIRLSNRTDYSNGGLSFIALPDMRELRFLAKLVEDGVGVYQSDAVEVDWIAAAGAERYVEDARPKYVRYFQEQVQLKGFVWITEDDKVWITGRGLQMLDKYRDELQRVD